MEIALHHLVSGVEIQLAAREYALSVFIDIEGAFDSISIERRPVSNCPQGKVLSPLLLGDRRAAH